MQFATQPAPIHEQASNTAQALDKKDPSIVDVFSFNWSSINIEKESSQIHSQHITEENDSSSTDSFPLMEGPSSHISSASSLSGFFKSPKSSSPSNKSRRQHSNRSEGSSSFVFGRDKSGQSTKKAYVKLQSQCNKFKSQNNAGKANYLRLTLLPFMRNKTGYNNLVPPNSQIELALKVFASWWHECLEVMKSNFKNINGVDRDAFYEAVSSLIARPEWLEHQDKPVFRNLLCGTLVHLLTKCSTAVHLPISLAAVTGKCLAYAFLFVPHMAVYLLNLLDVSSSTLKRLGNVDMEQKINKPETTTSGDSTPKGTPRGTPGLTSFIPPLPHFNHPSYLKDLVDTRVKPSTHNLKFKLPWFPFDTCKNWERFFVVDSSLFVSFFKHLCVLQTQSLPISYNKDSVEFGDETKLFAIHGEATILSAPGMRLIFASIVTYLDKIVADSGRSISPRNSNPYGMRSQSDSPNRRTNNPLQRPMLNDNFNVNAVASSAASGSPPNSPQRFRADQLKVFSAMREILHSDETTVPYVLAYSRIFDRILRAFAVNVRAHDVDGCVIACDLAEEWIYSVAAVKSTKACTAIVTFKHLTLDWEFWITVVKRMMSTDNIHTEIRALSFLYNVWPHLPNTEVNSSSENQTILNDPRVESKTLTSLLAEWLLSSEVWLKFFCNWCPLVRSYYHRLVCYRVASVGEDSGSWLVDVESAQCIAESRQVLQHRLATTFLWCQALSENTKMKPEVLPSLPMPRMRVGVRQIGPSTPVIGTKIETNATRIYPFDVFDSAAYWQRDASNNTEEEVTSAPKLYQHSNSSVSSTSSMVSTNSGLSTPPPSTGKRVSRISSSPQLHPSPLITRSASRTSLMSNSDTIGEVSPSDEYPSDPSTPEKSTETSTKDSAKSGLMKSPSTVSLSRMSVAVSPLKLRRKDKQSSSSPTISKEMSNKEKSYSFSNLKGNYLQKRWSNIRKLITGKEGTPTSAANTSPTGNTPQSSSKDTNNSNNANNANANANKTTPSSTHKSIFALSNSSSSSSSSQDEQKSLKAPFTYHSPPGRKPKAKPSKKMEKLKYLNATPIELTRPRPEIVRPSHRFVMIPTNARPSAAKTIQLPKLPFSPPVHVDQTPFNCHQRKQEKDLSIWNYGGRSIAEWNIEVSCFEGFIRLQEKTYSDTLEMFNMPFLVAEIPWRTLG